MLLKSAVKDVVCYCSCKIGNKLVVKGLLQTGDNRSNSYGLEKYVSMGKCEKLNSICNEKFYKIKLDLIPFFCKICFMIYLVINAYKIFILGDAFLFIFFN